MIVTNVRDNPSKGLNYCINRYQYYPEAYQPEITERIKIYICIINLSYMNRIL